MSIPKIIYQTFKTGHLPFITNWHIARLRQKNPSYAYEFYDDARISEFIYTTFGHTISDLYQRLRIGAAKADFFRYAILYERGGIYLDIDSLALSKLDDVIRTSDEALISCESHPGLFLQWALVYNAHHPFLQQTLEDILWNIETNAYPNDIHKMTGPTAYTQAIRKCLDRNPDIPYRIIGTDFNGAFKFHYAMSKFFLYSGNEHWKKAQEIQPLLSTVL